MVAKKRKRIPWSWITAVLVAGGGLGSWAWWSWAGAAKANELPEGVQAGTVTRGELRQKITATGVVAAQTGAKVNIGSQITGRIRSLPADVGTTVRTGQIVAVLDSPDLKAQVEQQRENVRVAEANLSQADSRLKQARLTVHFSEEQTSAQIDQAEADLRAARERLRGAEAAAKMQPTETASEIARADAALSTARSLERQTRETVSLQLLQSQTSIDDAKAALDNARKTLRRQEQLLQRGYISQQEVDDSRTLVRQAVARLDNTTAALSVVREKTAADLQAAKDGVAQALATAEAARAGRFRDSMRASDERSAKEAIRQYQAALALRRSSLTQDVIRKRALDEAGYAVSQSRAALNQARALLRYQEAQLDKAVIRSPINGTVLSITAQQGETIAAGFSAPTLITVADLDRLEVRAYVDEVDIGRVRLGLPAEVRVESFTDRIFHGAVSKAASASTVKDNVVTYETTVAIRDARGLLRPDMTADVALILGRLPNVLLVPSEAVHREVTRTVVYVLHRKKQGKERVETRVVTIGTQDATQTEVRTGLKEGEEVVLAGLQRLGVKAADAQNAEGKKEQ